jgi:tetratricopeptide (TPR) repeat protein
VAEQNGDTERVLAAHFHHFIAHVTIADMNEAHADLVAMVRIADELRQPAQRWLVCAQQATLALAMGRLTEGEDLARQALPLGEGAQADHAIAYYRLQLYTLCEFRGELHEIAPAVRELVHQHPARPIFRCALAHLDARLGRTDEARREFDDLARDDFSALPFDQEWLYGMSLLAESCAALNDTHSAVVLYEKLLPYAAFNAANGEGFRGAVSRYLGILATTTKRWDQAQRHFELALATNGRMGARPWLAHTQHDYAGMLIARGHTGDRERARKLLNQARFAYRKLGMDPHPPNFSTATHVARHP